MRVLAHPLLFFVIQSEAKDLVNIKWVLSRFFTTLRSVLNDSFYFFYFLSG